MDVDPGTLGRWERGEGVPTKRSLPAIVVFLLHAENCK